MHFNQVQITGRAGHEAELYFLSDGTPFARLRLYHDHRDGSDDGNHQTTVVTVIAWGRLAETLHGRIRRGDNLLVHGKLKLHTWREKGQPRSQPEVHLDRFFLIGRSVTSRAAPAEASAVDLLGRSFQ